MRSTYAELSRHWNYPGDPATYLRSAAYAVSISRSWRHTALLESRLHKIDYASLIKQLDSRHNSSTTTSLWTNSWRRRVSRCRLLFQRGLRSPAKNRTRH